MAASDRLTITAGAALQLIDASSRGPIDDASACITFTGDTTEYTYTQLGKGLAKRYAQKGGGMYTCANLPAGSYQATVTCNGYAEVKVWVDAIGVPLGGTIAQAIAVCELDPGYQSPLGAAIGIKLIDRDRKRTRYADTHRSARRKERG
jgi:hypothetical protein